VRLTRASLKIGIGWWWAFALFICVPAFALALLGLRAARVEQIERAGQWRAQQTAFARVADASLSALIDQVEDQLRSADASEPGAQTDELSDTPMFSLDRHSLLSFSREKVYLDDSGALGNKPYAVEWRLRIEQLIESAETAEAQKRTSEALVSYRKVAAAEPRLSDWARICQARVRFQSGDLGAKKEITDPTLSRSEGTTPTGLPVALIASAFAEQLDAEARADFIPLIEQTLDNLRRGRWWLSFDERQFYDGELRGLLESSGKHTTDDNRLNQLAAISRIVRQAPPSRNDSATRSFERDEQEGFLLVRLPSRRDPDVWIGIAVAQHHLEGLLDNALLPVLSGQVGAALIRDAQGNRIWGLNYTSSLHGSEPLRGIPGWEISFGGPVSTAWTNRRIWLWYGFIALLVVMLIVGLAMTVRVVQREAELARLQNEFVAGVSHEFKSPITGIRLLMERLSSGRSTVAENQKEYRRAINSELNRLERHVDRLLEAQKVQEGRKQYSFAPASLAEIAENAVDELRSHAEAKGISLELQASADIPSIPLDKAAISGVFENLIDNAIKYSPAGTRIDVLIRRNGDRVLVDVCDQGIGIEPDDLSSIFDKFYRARRGDQQSAGGSGLGLTLVKAAVEAHGGTVEVASKPGEGSRFTISLPLDRRVE
jgi:signal transduction histidine kinase